MNAKTQQQLIYALMITIIGEIGAYLLNSFIFILLTILNILIWLFVLVRVTINRSLE